MLGVAVDHVARPDVEHVASQQYLNSIKSSVCGEYIRVLALLHQGTVYVWRSCFVAMLTNGKSQLMG